MLRQFLSASVRKGRCKSVPFHHAVSVANVGMASTSRKRLMSSPSGGGWTWSKIIPAFGSKPIPPEEDITSTSKKPDFITEEPTEQVTTFDLEPMSTLPTDGQVVDDFPPMDVSMSKDIPDYGIDTISSQSQTGGADATIDSAIAAAEQIAAFEPSWWPSDQCLVLLNWVNESFGLPCYAVTIGATTLAFRVITFPLFVKAQRNTSRMAHAQPELNRVKEEVEKHGKSIPQEAQQRVMQQTKALFKKYDCNPLASLLAPLVTAPFFMSMFLGLRRAPELFPDLLSTGGVLWFPDLSAADPYCIMPFISAGTFLAMTEVGKDQMMASDPARGRTMVNAFRALAIMMVPITMNFNSGVFVYWTVNNTWSFFQALLLRQPAIKKSFGIWEPPKPVPGQEVKGIFDEVKRLMDKKKVDVPNALSEDRVKAHNQIIEQQKMVKKKLLEKERFKSKNR